MLDFAWSRCSVKRKASKLNRATLERPLLVTDVLWSAVQLVASESIYVILKSNMKVKFVLHEWSYINDYCSIPSEEVMLLSVCHVVWSRSTKAVIQQYVETENRTVGQWVTVCHENTISPPLFQYWFSHTQIHYKHSLIQMGFTYFPVRLTALTST